MSTVQVSLDAATKVVNESDRAAYFTVTRSGGVSGHSATVQYTLGAEGDTATYFQDYRSLRNGSITFGKGETTKTIRVSIFNDEIDEKEDYERFTVRLTGIRVSNGGQGILGNNTAQGVIIDDDRPALKIQMADLVNESAGQVTAVIALTTKCDQDVVVNYNVYGYDGLTYGRDFSVVGGGSSGVLTFKPGELQKKLVLQIVNDTTVEDVENFTLTASSRQVDYMQFADCFVKDDDRAFFRIEASADSGTASEFEGDSGTVNVSLRIVLECDTEVELIAPYATFDGAAREADGDYQGVWGESLFASGSKAGTAKTIKVKINGDRRIEGHEHFFVKLLPSADNYYRRQFVKVSIMNDD